MSDQKHDSLGPNDLHAKNLKAKLDVLAQKLEHEPISVLLETLVDAHEFSWNTLARCIKNTPTAARRWRRGDQGPSSEEKQRVAYLLAFTAKICEIVDDVDYCLTSPMSSESSAARMDLYRVGAAVDLTRLARSQERLGLDSAFPYRILDFYIPDWRITNGSDERFSVVWDSNGIPSIVFEESKKGIIKEL